MFRYFVLKGFKTSFLIPEHHDLSIDDIEGIIHSTTELSSDQLNKHTSFLKKSFDFLSEYDIDWNRGVILVGVGSIHSTYEDMASLKNIKELNCWFFTVDQLKSFNDELLKYKLPLDECMNTLVREEGRLFLVDNTQFNKVAVKNSNSVEIFSPSPDATVSNAPKNKNPNLKKQKKEVSQSIKNRNRRRFMRQIGR